MIGATTETGKLIIPKKKCRKHTIGRTQQNMEGHRLILRSRTCRIEFVQEESVHQFNGNILPKFRWQADVLANCKHVWRDWTGLFPVYPSTVRHTSWWTRTRLRSTWRPEVNWRLQTPVSTPLTCPRVVCFRCKVCPHYNRWSLWELSSCSDPLAAVARHAELTAVRVRCRLAVKQSCHLWFVLKSKAFTCALTRAINSHFIVTSKHTLRFLEGESKDHRKRLSNLERMDHSLEDGTAGIEDKTVAKPQCEQLLLEG